MKNKKVSVITAVIIGILSGSLTFGGMAFAATGKNIFVSDNSLSLKDYKELSEFQSLLKDYYYKDLDNTDFITGIKKGMTESIGDPYTHYLTLEEYNKDLEIAQGSFVGVGVYIAPSDDGKIIVIAPVKNSPAEKAGIKSGDYIVSVNGKNFTAKTIQEATSLMRGKKGETVTIGLLSAGKQKVVNVVRDDIMTQSVFSNMVKNKPIGLISISSFDEDTGKEFSEELDKLLKKNPKALIIDLRSNPGGMVDQVIKVADRILDKETIFFTNNKKGEKKVYTGKTDAKLSLPIAVLVNKNSASASEILSGALQDNKKAIIIGENTFGKGLVQSLFQIDEKGAIIITVAQYFTPNGNQVNKTGIKPDIEVKTELNTDKKDAQLEKAIEVLSSKLEK